MRLLVWLVRAAIFFVLFAFALNNQHETAVRWFFGFEWRAPMVIVVLAAFGAGCVLGVLAMLPGWWRQRQSARTSTPPAAAATSTPVPAAAGIPAAFEAAATTQPPRDGL